MGEWLGWCWVSAAQELTQLQLVLPPGRNPVPDPQRAPNNTPYAIADKRQTKMDICGYFPVENIHSSGWRRYYRINLK